MGTRGLARCFHGTVHLGSVSSGFVDASVSSRDLRVFQGVSVGLHGTSGVFQGVSGRVAIDVRDVSRESQEVSGSPQSILGVVQGFSWAFHGVSRGSRVCFGTL